MKTEKVLFRAKPNADFSGWNFSRDPTLSAVLRGRKRLYHQRARIHGVKASGGGVGDGGGNSRGK